MIDRRRFLRGAGGALVALPFIGALQPRSSWANATSQVYTFIMRNANGVAQAGHGEPEQFWPRSLGRIDRATLQDDDAGRGGDPASARNCAIAELASYADKMLLVTGTIHPFNHQFCGHSSSAAQALTASRFVMHDNKVQDISSDGPSVDWVLARYRNPKDVPPLNLRAGPSVYFGYDTVIYSARGVKVNGEPNPYAVYQRLFSLSNVDEQTQRKLALRRTSVNDLVRSEMSELLQSAELGAADKARLRRHFDAIRDLEVKIMRGLDAAAVDALRKLTVNDEGASSTEFLDEGNRVKVAEMQIELAALAFAGDLTRVATLQMGNTNDHTRYWVGNRQLENFHTLSHRFTSDVLNDPNRQPIPTAIRDHHAIDRLFLRTFKRMADRLAEYELLDQSLCWWTNDLGSGVAHSGDENSPGDPLPQVFIGSANGALRTGGYIDAGRAFHNKLLNTVLAVAGARDSDGGQVSMGDPSLARGVIDAMLS